VQIKLNDPLPLRRRKILDWDGGRRVRHRFLVITRGEIRVPEKNPEEASLFFDSLDFVRMAMSIPGTLIR
jgi:hypothetical protein